MTMDLVSAVAVAIGAYLVGAVPFGYLVARARGVDIFRQGSGNIGATNVGRVLGWQYGLLVFALDALKGALPMALAQWLHRVSFPGSPSWDSGWVEVACALAAFLGHLFPVYLGFRGGKGVATGAGAVLVLVPVPALAALAAWLILTAAHRTVSLSSIAAVMVLGAVQLWQSSGDLLDPRTLFCLAGAALVIARHHANVRRLLAGTENQIADHAALFHAAKVVHVLAVGLWFGASIFFSFVVAISLFDTFGRLGASAERPTWFPLAPEFAKIDNEEQVHGPKEQGSRVAGHAVTPLFQVYFPLQLACALIALATATAWMRVPGRQHRWRGYVLMLAVVLVLAGWWVEMQVADLRPARNTATEAYLRTDASADREAMLQARGEFARWHLASLLLNFATIGCATAVMALAAGLPARQPAQQANAFLPSPLGGDRPGVRVTTMQRDDPQARSLPSPPRGERSNAARCSHGSFCTLGYPSPPTPLPKGERPHAVLWALCRAQRECD